MVKPLSFKGDKKVKKRKRPENTDDPTSRAKQLQKVEDGEATGEGGVEQEDDSWVSAEADTDLNGPVMIVLPSEVPSALACDPAGKVFAIPIENIVDGNTITAEPHDVRMVWVINRVSGTESFRFKGHHGKYLGCDRIGVLSATSQAVSPEESFNAVPTADTPGTFQLKTQRGTYLTIAESESKSKGKDKSKDEEGGSKVEVRGDAEEVDFNTTLRIRMQARYKPKLKASKEEKAREKISRKTLEEAVGRRLGEEEVRVLKRARREGDYHEKLLEIKVKGKHDKYS